MNPRKKCIIEAYTVKPTVVSFDDGSEPLLSQEDAQVLCPLSEFGYPSDVLQRAISADSESLRNSLLSQLSNNAPLSNSQFASLDDETLMNLCKLRSCQTLGEVKRYVDALGAYFDINNVNNDPQPPSPSDDSQPSSE